MVIHTKKGTWVKILRVTICEVKACNRASVKRFNIHVNFREQFLLFPQNLKFLNTFLVFLIIHIKFDLSRSGDSNNKTCKTSFEVKFSTRNIFAVYLFTTCCNQHNEGFQTSCAEFSYCILRHNNCIVHIR